MRKLFFVIAAVVAIPVAIMVAFFVFRFVSGMIIGGHAASVHDGVYQCEKIDGRRVGYVYVRGFGEDGPDASYEVLEAMKADARFVGVLDYDYDEDLLLDQISDAFLEKFTDFVEAKKPDALIIFGYSAGGVVISNVAHHLDFSGSVYVHTMASPLAGYNLASPFLGNKEGYIRQLASGIGSFTAADNTQVSHHKTIIDSTLTDFCGNAKRFCEPLKVQNNNVPGSADYYYPQEDHQTIVMKVVDSVMSCQK